MMVSDVVYFLIFGFVTLIVAAKAVKIAYDIRIAREAKAFQAQKAKTD